MRVIRCDRCPAEGELTGASLSSPPFWRSVHIGGAGAAKHYELCPKCGVALKEWLEPVPPEPVEERVPASQQLLPVEIPEKAVITDEDIPF